MVNVGFDELKQHNKGCHPSVNMEVQVNENGLDYSIGIREMDESNTKDYEILF